jgi:hypothetical protein
LLPVFLKRLGINPCIRQKTPVKSIEKPILKAIRICWK